MSRGHVLALTIAACLLWIWLIRHWSGVLAEHRALMLVNRPTESRGRDGGIRRRIDLQLRRTRPGRAFGDLLDRAALPFTVLDGALITVAGVAMVTTICWLLLNRTAALALLVTTPLVVRAVLLGFARRRARRMIDQLPELAGALAGGAAAGLALPVALRAAAEDLPEPLAGELRQALESLSVGTSTDSALREIARRIPSREIDLLVTTLVIQTRGGGNLVKALRRLTDSLERRREMQREYRSLTAGSTSTAYLMIFFGLAITAMVQRTFPGSLDRTLGNPVGRIAILLSLVLYVAGIVLVRRISRRAV